MGAVLHPAQAALRAAHAAHAARRRQRHRPPPRRRARHLRRRTSRRWASRSSSDARPGVRRHERRLWSLSAVTGAAAHRETASPSTSPACSARSRWERTLSLACTVRRGRRLHRFPPLLTTSTTTAGNTALALLLGAQRRFEVTGEATFAALNDHFARLVLDSRTYATGASTHNELWDPPGQLGHTLKSGGARSTTARLASRTTWSASVSLLRASGGAVQHAEYIERALFNGVLGSQRGIEPGRCSTSSRWATA